MKVQELLRTKNPDVVSIRTHTRVSVATDLLMKHRIGGLPVIGPGGTAVGFLSERDLVRAVNDHTGPIRDLRAEQVMMRPAPTCSVADLLVEVMDRMTRERLRHLVVLQGDRIAGVISVGDLVKHRLEQLETETGVLRDYLAAQRARG